MQKICGRIIRGKGEGRKLGYPTANLEYICDQVPEPGVWICRGTVQGMESMGLAVIGMWSLPNGSPSLEVYLLDVERDLYDQDMEVIFVKKLRDLKKFFDVKSLIKQIEQDIEEARRLFPV
ncbi:hypothetical protein EXS71_03365 [Candidatus Uhrbacteria bacterium]|nr:hypothetical protein [Candidatus Uhrbacteria bacterium]